MYIYNKSKFLEVLSFSVITFDFFDLNQELYTDKTDKSMINLLALVPTVNWCLLLLNHECILDQFLNQISVCLAPSVYIFFNSR